MKDYVKQSDLEFAAQLKHFANKLSDHNEGLGITAEELNEAKIAADYVNYVIEMQRAHIERSRNWTAFKDILRHRGAGFPTISIAPGSLALPSYPIPAPLGIEKWFRSIVKRVRGSKNYHEAIGKDLRIIAPTTANDFEHIQPELKIQLVAGQPIIIWKKQGMSAIEIFKDSGDGKWQLLDIDTSPNHLDTSALPNPGTSITWKYKAIYRYLNKRVGN